MGVQGSIWFWISVSYYYCVLCIDMITPGWFSDQDLLDAALPLSVIHRGGVLNLTGQNR